MERKERIAKYQNVLMKMSEAGEIGDNDVLMDKLEYMIKKYFNDDEFEDTYAGIPDDFDYEIARDDFAHIFTNIAE